MKILVIESEVPGVPEDAYEPHLRAEAARAWELYQDGIIRELYFRAGWPGAVLVLECAGIDEANEVLATLPLVRHGLIAFEVIPLTAYPGFSRLFATAPGDGAA